MQNKEKQILTMLQQGKTYTQIQNLLHVSSKKIAKVRKQYLEMESDADNIDDFSGDYDADEGSVNMFGESDESRSDESASSDAYADNTSGILPEESTRKNYFKEFTNDKNKIKMKDDLLNEDNLDSYDRAEIIKKKLDMQHELELANIELRKKALQLEEEKLQKEEQRRASALVSRFRKLADKIKDGKWYISEIQDLYEKVADLKIDIENFCNEFDIYSEGLKIINQICLIEETLDELLSDGYEDDEEIEFDFDEELHDIREGARKLNFYDYE